MNLACPISLLHNTLQQQAHFPSSCQLILAGLAQSIVDVLLVGVSTPFSFQNADHGRHSNAMICQVVHLVRLSSSQHSMRSCKFREVLVHDVVVSNFDECYFIAEFRQIHANLLSKEMIEKCEKWCLYFFASFLFTLNGQSTFTVFVARNPFPRLLKGPERLHRNAVLESIPPTRQECSRRTEKCCLAAASAMIVYDFSNVENSAPKNIAASNLLQVPVRNIQRRRERNC
jgi:hypothetical protein